jgi:hypothetical protein
MVIKVISCCCCCCLAAEDNIWLAAEDNLAGGFWLLEVGWHPLSPFAAAAGGDRRRRRVSVCVLRNIKNIL